MYPHFDIYPSVQGDRVDRSYAPHSVPGTSAIQTQGRALSASSPALNTRSTLQVDRIGYPVLNICTYFLSSAIRVFSRHYPHITRRSNRRCLDPAVYPCLEIYPKVQTVQSRPKIWSGDHEREFKSYIHSRQKEILKGQPWGFGWPWFQPVFPPASTSSSVSPLTSSPAPTSVMVYPVIKICEPPMIWGIVWSSFTNHDTHRPRGLSFLRCVSCRRTLHPCSTFQTSPGAEPVGRH